MIKKGKARGEKKIKTNVGVPRGSKSFLCFLFFCRFPVLPPPPDTCPPFSHPFLPPRPLKTEEQIRPSVDCTFPYPLPLLPPPPPPPHPSCVIPPVITPRKCTCTHPWSSFKTPNPAPHICRPCNGYELTRRWLLLLLLLLLALALGSKQASCHHPHHHSCRSPLNGVCAAAPIQPHPTPLRSAARALQIAALPPRLPFPSLFYTYPRPPPDPTTTLLPS